MLDNFTPADARDAVAWIRERHPGIEIELSGGMRSGVLGSDGCAHLERLQRDDLFARAEWSARPGLLSMGMSADFEVAVEEGATHVRVGTLLFGERPG